MLEKDYVYSILRHYVLRQTLSLYVLSLPA